MRTLAASHPDPVISFSRESRSIRTPESSALSVWMDNHARRYSPIRPDTRSCIKPAPARQGKSFLLRSAIDSDVPGGARLRSISGNCGCSCGLFLYAASRRARPRSRHSARGSPSRPRRQPRPQGRRAFTGRGAVAPHHRSNVMMTGSASAPGGKTTLTPVAGFLGHEKARNHEPERES